MSGMNGTGAFTQLDDTDDFGLDQDAEPILCVAEMQRETLVRLSAVKQSSPCYDALSFAELARLHISEPRAATRTALASMPVATKADGIAAMALLKCDGDSDLHAHLVAELSAFVAAA